MKEKDVIKKETEIITKTGVKNSDGKIIVPIEYDFVTKVNDNLYVATKGSINGLRHTTGRITCTTENGGTYGVIFNKMVEDKTLDTEVEFYTKEGKMYSGSKILAAVVCKNDDMLLLLHEDYKWSMALIDYQNYIVLGGAYVDVDSIEMDYESNRFIIGLNNRYVIVSFKDDNRIDEATSILPGKPVKLCEKGAIIKSDDKCGFVTYSGEVILSCIYDEVIETEFYLQTKQNERIELYSYRGEYIIGGDYISIKPVCLNGYQLFLVEGKENKFGLYSTKNKLLSVNYSEILIGGYDNQIVVLKNGRRLVPWLYYDGEKDKLYVKRRSHHKNTKVYVDEAGYDNL